MSTESQIDTDDAIEHFARTLVKHAQRKRELYDGAASAVVSQGVDTWIRYAVEELGEIASAISRDRYLLARYECLDLAHCAMIMFIILDLLREGGYE